MKKHNDDNAKDPRFKPPVALPSVMPGDYIAADEKAKHKADSAGPPYYTRLGHPSGEKTATQEARRKSTSPR